MTRWQRCKGVAVHSVQDALGNGFGFPGICLGKEDHEFIASIPTDDVDVLPQPLGNCPGKLDENMVPDLMAEAVIDRFEIIDVHEDDPEVLGSTLHLGHLFVGPDFKISAHMDLGQPIENRHFKKKHILQGESENRG